MPQPSRIISVTKVQAQRVQVRLRRTRRRRRSPELNSRRYTHVQHVDLRHWRRLIDQRKGLLKELCEGGSGKAARCQLPQLALHGSGADCQAAATGDFQTSGVRAPQSIASGSIKPEKPRSVLEQRQRVPCKESSGCVPRQCAYSTASICS